MPAELPQVYEGDRPYIFVNYAHADDEVVLPMISKLVQEGYRVWWDDGIQLAVEFPEYIANHIHGCHCFVMFVSRSSLASDWCKREVNYALLLHKTILPIYLEDVELTRGLELVLCTTQATFWYRFRSDEAFYRKLFETPAISRCLTEGGKRRNGVKPRGDSQVDGVSIADVYSTPLRVGRKDDVAAYSWAELKELSRKIAAAGSDAEGLAIAKVYGLAEKDGQLQGDQKPLVLKDGTKASVRILGFRHDELADDSKAGISFEFASVPATYRMNPTDDNAVGWDASEMRAWLNEDFFSKLPDDLRPLVEPAWKQTNNNGKVNRENDVSVVRRNADVPDRPWLLSMSEVYGKLSEQTVNKPWSPATYDAEGMQYQLYADQGVSTASYGFCKKNGASSWWWLRSPSANGSSGFYYVYDGGDWSWHYASSGLGVSPGFCF